MAPKNDRIAAVVVAACVVALLAFVAGPFRDHLAGSKAFAQEAGQRAAQQPAQKAAPSGANTEVKQTTEVGGKIPAEFLGRWVAFAHVKLPSGLLRHFARLWEIREGDEHYELLLQRGNVPQEISRKLDDATAAGEPWEASPEDIKLISERWDQLMTNSGAAGKIENKLLAAGSYPPEFERDVVTKGSEYAIVFNEVFGGGNQSISRTYSIFAVRKREPDRMTGTFITSSMAMAPFPIPITLKGDFEAYRVGKPTPPSFIQRVLRVFSGCRS
jgi:hypothetical protein